MRLSTYLIGIPIVIVAAVVAIANRQVVTFSLDPFSLSHPSEAVSVQMPLFVLLLLTLAIGVVLGGLAASWSHFRRRTKQKSGLPRPPEGPTRPEQ